MRAAICLLLLGACHPAAPSPPSPPPSNFGFYLLAMMWTPSSCALTLHGLWPNYTDEQSRGRARAWPQYCGRYAHCETAEDASCAPGVPVPAALAPLAPAYLGDGSFATHEWSKHGSCTSLPAAAFFAAELAAIHLIPDDATPAALRRAAGQELAREDLRAAFGVPPASVVLGCDDHCRLTQVGFCIAKDAHDGPVAPTACSANVTSSDYDNGCTMHHCDRVAIPGSAACGAPLSR